MPSIQDMGAQYLTASYLAAVLAVLEQVHALCADNQVSQQQQPAGVGSQHTTTAAAVW
jgi:hypothetical protein